MSKKVGPSPHTDFFNANICCDPGIQPTASGAKAVLGEQCVAQRPHSAFPQTSSKYTDKKEKEIFLIYKEIQMGSVAKSYMRNGFLIFEEMRKYLTIQYRTRRSLDYATAI